MLWQPYKSLFQCSQCKVNFKLNFKFTSNSLQSHFKLTSNSLQSQLQTHSKLTSKSTSNSLQSHFKVTSNSLQSQLQTHFKLTSNSLQTHFKLMVTLIYKSVIRYLIRVYLYLAFVKAALKMINIHKVIISAFCIFIFVAVN